MTAVERDLLPTVEAQNVELVDYMDQILDQK